MHSRSSRGLVSVLAACAFTVSAFAGYQTKQPVSINDEDKQVNGDLGYVRNTSDSVQYIGCYINGGAGICKARNLAGTTRSCSTTDPKWVSVIATLNGDSNLYFRWNDDGKCTMVIVEQRSALAPK